MSTPTCASADSAGASSRLSSAARCLAGGVSALALGAIAAGTSASAQVAAAPGSLQPIPGTLKSGGTFHVATGTWTRPAASASAFGPDLTIYSSTYLSGYFTTAGGSGGFGAGATNFDEGGLPGLRNGHPFSPGPDRDVYTVTAFEIGYCDFAPTGPSDHWEISFYESHVPCTASTAPASTIAPTGLPTNGCWTITIDLTGGEEFEMRADGGDGWDDDPDLDSFGWSYRYLGSLNNIAGFILTGNPRATDPGWMAGQIPIAGSGTYYGGPGLCPGASTGYLNQDFWWLEDSANPANSGCFNFFFNPGATTDCGGPSPPYASFYMEIYGEAAPPAGFGEVYCESEPNSTGATTAIAAIGSDVATDNAVTLTGSQMPAGAIGYFLTSPDQGFVANPGGSAGNLCLSGPVGRFNQTGQVKVANSSGNVSLSSGLGEWSTSSIPIAIPPLSYAATAGTTTNFQFWHRDFAGGVSSSNFSNGLAVTWQ